MFLLFSTFTGHRTRGDERDQPFEHFGFSNPRLNELGPIGPIDTFRQGMPFAELHAPNLQPAAFNTLTPGEFTRILLNFMWFVILNAN